MDESKPSNGLSNMVDNIDTKIQKGLKLVSSYILTNLPLAYRDRELRLSDTIDILSELRLNLTQKKIIYWLLLVGFTYPNELGRIYDKSTQLFKAALHSLVQKGFVKLASDSPLLATRKKYLDRELNTTPIDRKEGIVFHELTAGAINYFQVLQYEIEEELMPYLTKAKLEANRYNTVLRQQQEKVTRQIESNRAKKEEEDQKERLSIEVDKLTITHESNFLMLRVEIDKLITLYPVQRIYLLKTLRQLEEFNSGKGRLAWRTIVEQARRRVEVHYSRKN